MCRIDRSDSVVFHLLNVKRSAGNELARQTLQVVFKSFSLTSRTPIWSDSYLHCWRQHSLSASLIEKQPLEIRRRAASLRLPAMPLMSFYRLSRSRQNSELLVCSVESHERGVKRALSSVSTCGRPRVNYLKVKFTYEHSNKLCCIFTLGRIKRSKRTTKPFSVNELITSGPADLNSHLDGVQPP